MSFAEATGVQQLDSHTYSADFREGWTIGTVPHGGYVTSCFQQVVRKHFDTTLAGQKQPHTITLHLDFLRRTQLGPATFRVKDVKLGRQTSVVHVTLFQDSREEVVGYITNSNIETEKGISFDSDWQVHPKPLPVADFARLEADDDDAWGERKEWPFVNFRTATTKLRAWFPRKGQHSQTCLDSWMCVREPNERWTQESLGFVVDMFPQIVESILLDGIDSYSIEFERQHSHEEQVRLMKGKPNMWYPTLLLNMDVKKALPAEGAQWLYQRVQAKAIKNGRYDLEVIVMDQAGDLVALSHHVVFAVSAERNTASRRNVESGTSKL